MVLVRPELSVLLPMSEALADWMPMLMVWLALAPTWNWDAVREPSSTFWPLNWVVLATRSSSWDSAETSPWIDLRSESELVPLADCTASSRIRCSRSPAVLKPPSAVCASEMPSLALRAAWVLPRICEVKRWEIARPAASSLSLLMRKPEDRRCREVDSEACDVVRLRCEFSDAIFVLMTCAMMFLQTDTSIRQYAQFPFVCLHVPRHSNRCCYW